MGCSYPSAARSSLRRRVLQGLDTQIWSQPTYSNSAFNFSPLGSTFSTLTSHLTSSFSLAEHVRIYQNVKGLIQLYF